MTTHTLRVLLSTLISPRSVMSDETTLNHNFFRNKKHKIKNYKRKTDRFLKNEEIKFGQMGNRPKVKQ